MVYGAGWIGSWIAGENGAEALEACTPPYNEENDIKNVEIIESMLPITFQAAFLSLIDICEEFGIPEPEPKVLHAGVERVKEYITKENTPDISIAEVSVKGLVGSFTNEISTTAYQVTRGTGHFEVWEPDGFKQHKMKKGSRIVIPRGTRYQFLGDMTMVCVNRPAYDPTRVRILE